MKPKVRSNEIRFFIKPKSTPENIQTILNQVANMIYGLCGQGVAIEKEGGYRWGLGWHTSAGTEVNFNDWWADIGALGDAPNEVVIAYRYGMSKEMSEKLSKLRDTIIWLLDLERFNPSEMGENGLYGHQCAKGHYYYSSMAKPGACPACLSADQDLRLKKATAEFEAKKNQPPGKLP